MPTQIADVIVPSEFSAYVSENSLQSTALFEFGVLVRKGALFARSSKRRGNP